MYIYYGETCTHHHTNVQKKCLFLCEYKYKIYNCYIYNSCEVNSIYEKDHMKYYGFKCDLSPG